jgi:hypothetical protein
MNSDPEVFSSLEVLRLQMSTNEEQLRHLKRLASAEHYKTIYLQVLVIVLACGIGLIAYAMVLEPSHLPFRREIYDLGGIIVVFMIFATVLGFRAIVSSWARRREIYYVCSLQQEALQFAQRVLNNEIEKEPRRT